MENLNQEKIRQEMIYGFSDYHKDAYGFRPRWDYTKLSIEELKEYFDEFGKEVEASFIREKAREEQGIKDFEKLVENIKNICSCDRITAIKYLMDAEDLEYDDCYNWDYFCYLYNLPYKYKQ